ncbi:MAG TPA: AMP-binding protein [Micromonosporaceae bacterium]|nr:AMP-binding protein [Micromonosporaceae bacterium]
MTTLFSLFRRSVDEHPDALAIEVQDERLTYTDLSALVDRLAARLADTLGRSPVSVGLLASRSLAAYAGYLATLRLGARVVPLNPAFPPSRTATMCRLGGVEVLLVDDVPPHYLASLGELVRVAAVVLRTDGGGRWYEDGSLAGSLGGEPPDDPDAPAYILFTSGSTGEPKGVSISCRQLVPYLAYARDRYATGPGCRLSQAFDLTFDPSVFDMFVAWTSAAALVVPQPNAMVSPVDFVNRKAITHWFSVPSVISLAKRLRTLRPGSMPQLRWSLFAGEQLTLAQARAWAAAAPASIVENLYGPTEMTITCVQYRLPPDQQDWPETSNGTVPIGQAYPHLESLVVTGDSAPGDDGELCLRGPQRFGGYLDPADNTGRFIRTDQDAITIYDGRSRLTGDYWYRTGDRVRMECGGELVHIGRIDQQVKIRGYRIEPGEIESVLRHHPGIEDVVVVAVPGSDSEPDLHAVYTGVKAVPDELAARVAGRLPWYMVPRRYHHRPGLPANASGKIDRRRIAAELVAVTSGTAAPGAAG